MNDKTGWCANMFDTNKYFPILEVHKKNPNGTTILNTREREKETAIRSYALLDFVFLQSHDVYFEFMYGT